MSAYRRYNFDEKSDPKDGPCPRKSVGALYVRCYHWSIRN